MNNYLFANDFSLTTHIKLQIHYYILTPWLISSIVYLLLVTPLRPWGVYFQDSASPQMEALVKLHSSMRIVIESISLEKFLSWLQEQ